MVHFRPFFYNVEISVFVSCAFEHGVLQLNIFKPEICLWDRSLFSVIYFFPAATGTLKERVCICTKYVNAKTSRKTYHAIQNDPAVLM